jgi:hypothetical protein
VDCPGAMREKANIHLNQVPRRLHERPAELAAANRRIPQSGPGLESLRPRSRPILRTQDPGS